MEENTQDFYKDSKYVLEAVEKELLLRVELMRRYFVLNGDRDPVEHCKSRDRKSVV